MKKLNDTQVKDLEKFLKSYKFVYICNDCGTVYGTDFQETNKTKVCHKCGLKKQEKRGRK